MRITVPDITVSNILEYLAGGMSEADIVEDFSELTTDDSIIGKYAKPPSQVYLPTYW